MSRAAAIRLHDEVIERLVVEAQERICKRLMLRRFEKAQFYPSDVTIEQAVGAARYLMEGATIVRRRK